MGEGGGSNVLHSAAKLLMPLGAKVTCFTAIRLVPLNFNELPKLYVVGSIPIARSNKFKVRSGHIGYGFGVNPLGETGNW